MPTFPPPAPPAPKRPRTNAVIIGSAAAIVTAVAIAGAAVASNDSTGEAKSAPTVTVTVTHTAEMTDQEIIDKAMEILDSAESDIEAGVEPDVSIPEIEAAEEEPSGPLTSIDEGTYLVGEDVEAGSYKTAGPTTSMCYWSRNKDDSGEFGAIIANDIVHGPGRVTLNKGEIFETNGCETWELAK
jgi:hypothetical protein